MSDRLPDPGAEQTFLASKLDWSRMENKDHLNVLSFYRDLLDIRRREIIPRLSRVGRRSGYLRISSRALKAWWVMEDSCTLMVMCNLHRNRIDIEPLPLKSKLIYHFTEEKQAGLPMGHLPPGYIPPTSIFWFLDRP